MKISKDQSEWSYQTKYGDVIIKVNEDYFDKCGELDIQTNQLEVWRTADDAIKYHKEVIAVIQGLKEIYEKANNKH